MEILCDEVGNYAAKTSHSSFIWAICENYDIFMGYSGSTYWTKKILTRQREIFRKVEPYLTFLNIPQLGDRSRCTIWHRDKVKDYAMSQLSDQLMALTTRMREIERKT